MATLSTDRHRIGLRNLAYAQQLTNTVDGVTYGEVKPFGKIAKEFKEKVNISSTDFRADTTIVKNFNKIDSKELELTLSYLTPEIEGAITNNNYDSTTGMVSTTTNVKPKPVALLGEYVLSGTDEKGDNLTERFVYLNVTFVIEESEAKGDSDKIEEYPVKLKGTAIAPLSTNKIDNRLCSDAVPTSGTAFENWFKVVQVNGDEKPATTGV